MSGVRVSPRAAAATLLLSAAYFVVGVLWWRTDAPDSIIAYDFYGQFYPWQVHAQRALQGAGGWLWNPYQDCGQVFFANIQAALLYPVNFVFLGLPREPALLACVFLNLLIASVGMLQLGRTLGLRVAAALSAALVFQLGWAATQIAAWSPTHLGTFVWFPVVLWRVEVLVRAPVVRNGLALAAALALQILAGFPQMVVFSYQLVALRLGWALLGREARVAPLLATAALATLLPPLLTAVQLVPALETVRAGLWGAPLGVKELGKPVAFRTALAHHVGLGTNAFAFALAGVAAAWLARRAPQRGAVLFYAVVAGLYFLLHLGPGTPLFDLYARLPVGTAFRGPARLLWVTNVCVAVLAGFAAEALLAGGARRERWRLALLLVVAAFVLQAISIRGLRPADAIPALLLALLVGWPRLRPLLPVALPALVVGHALAVGLTPIFTLRGGPVYAAHAPVVDAVRQRLTPQERIFIVGVHASLGLMPKSGTVFALPNIHDYDPMVLRTYAEFFTWLRTGRPYRELDDWYWLFGKLLNAGLQPALLDQTAARYLLVDHRLPRLPPVLAERLTLLADDGAVRLYEYADALPRARWVPRLAVLPAAEVLPQLARGGIDPRTTIAAAHAPRSGFTGAADGAGGGRVTFVSDAPESVVLRVEAPAPGFLFLADNWAAGWEATVDGTPAEIVRANHTFRAVEVPAGTSEVVFTYRPASLRIGALISGATLLGAGALWWRVRRRTAAVAAHGRAAA